MNDCHSFNFIYSGLARIKKILQVRAGKIMAVDIHARNMRLGDLPPAEPTIM